MKKLLGLALVLAGILLMGAVFSQADEVSGNRSTTVTTQPAMLSTPIVKTKKVKKAKKTAKAESKKTVWVCPMGDYTSDKPGKCPNCGMDLVEKK